VTEARWAKREATFYTHSFLWSDFEEVWKLLGTRDDIYRGLFTSALILLYSCLEAHLNFLGTVLFPDQWAEEREFFGGKPYRGTLGKLRFLADQLDVTIDKGRAPYTTLRQLEKRRHQLVHPHLEQGEERMQFTDPRELQPLKSAYNGLIRRDFLRSARSAVEEVANLLQRAAFKKYRGKVLGEHAFSLPLSVRGITIEG
jgi:hypothetical protein